MPSSHLACDGSTEPVSCPYPPFRAASPSSPCGDRRRLWDFRTDSRAPRPVRFCLARSYTNMKNRKSVARIHVVGGIAQSPHWHRAEAERSKTARWRQSHRTISAQSLHGSRTGSVRLPSGGCGDCTADPMRMHDFRTISAQPPWPLYGLTSACPRGPVGNVNTYAVARRTCSTYDS